MEGDEQPAVRRRQPELAPRARRAGTPRSRRTGRGRARPRCGCASAPRPSGPRAPHARGSAETKWRWASLVMRVTDLVVHGALRHLAAVEMGDRQREGQRGHRRGQHLEAVAEHDEHVRTRGARKRARSLPRPGPSRRATPAGRSSSSAIGIARRDGPSVRLDGPLRPPEAGPRGASPSRRGGERGPAPPRWPGAPAGDARSRTG